MMLKFICFKHIVLQCIQHNSSGARIKAVTKKLYTAYNNVFRMLHRLPRDCSASAMFVNSHVKNCSAIIRNLVYRFIRRLELSENGIILSVLNSDLRWQSRIRRHWINILYNNVDFLEKVPYN